MPTNPPVSTATATPSISDADVQSSQGQSPLRIYEASNSSQMAVRKPKKATHRLPLPKAEAMRAPSAILSRTVGKPRSPDPRISNYSFEVSSSNTAHFSSV